MLEVDEGSLAKENANRKSQIDSMIEESKREEEVSLAQLSEHTPSERKVNPVLDGQGMPSRSVRLLSPDRGGPRLLGVTRLSRCNGNGAFC